MKRIKDFFIIFFLFFLINIFVLPNSSLVRPVFAQQDINSVGGYNPGDDLTKNLPFDMSGVSCGVPNSKANKCCASSSSLQITSAAIDALMADLSDGNGKLSPQSADLLATIYLVQNPDSDLDVSSDLSPFKLYVITVMAVGASHDQARLNALKNGFEAAANKLSTLSGSDLLAIQVKKQFADDQCLIKGVGIQGFCMRGVAEFFGKHLGSHPVIAGILQSGKANKSEQCLFGDAVGQGISCRCIYNAGAAVLCNDYLQNSKEFNSCQDCYAHQGGIWTGLGCVRLTVAGFISGTLLGWGIGLAGILALLCIIYSAFILQTSRGNPERIKKAREYLTNCIIGLLLIIFSIFILRLIGVTILQIPGLG